MSTVRTLLTVSCIKSHSLPSLVKAIKPELTDSADNIAVASNLGMAEEFQAGICGGKYWWNFNSTKSVFPLTISSPCSMAANDAENYSSWQIDHSLVSDHSLGFLDEQKPQQTESASTSSQMMGFGVSSLTSSNWNQSLLRLESNFQSVLQEDMDSSNSQIQKDWSPTKSFSTSNIDDAFKPMNPEFCLDQQSLSSYGYTSKMMQSLYDHPHPDPQPQNSLFTNQSMAYSSTSNEVLPTWSMVSPFLKPEQQPSGLHFSNNNTPPFWNNTSSTEALDHDTRADVFASPQGQYQSQPLEEEPTCPTLITKPKREEAVDSGQGVKRSVCEPASFKRPRIETPSPLPTFKVRKEKLGDRITALQQLVSPFGKTDTASVLHEAIEYIKYLHDQVSVLSAPYMNSGTPIQHQQGSCDDQNESEGPKQDLRSRGLCLVPISSTFPVANEIAAELWTHTLGGALIG